MPDTPAATCRDCGGALERTGDSRLEPCPDGAGWTSCDLFRCACRLWVSRPRDKRPRLRAELP